MSDTNKFNNTIIINNKRIEIDIWDENKNELDAAILPQYHFDHISDLVNQGYIEGEVYQEENKEEEEIYIEGWWKII